MGSMVRGVRFSGPLESYAEGFAAQLTAVGYSSNAAKAQLFVVAHLSRWLAERGLEVAALTASTVEEFFADRRAAGYTNYRTPKALQPLLRFLRALGVLATAEVAVELDPVDALLERFRGYLVGERRLASTTARGYVDAVRPFVARRTRGGELDVEDLTAAEVTAFVVDVCPRQPRGSATMTVTALRSLLGFLHVDGVLSSSLVAAVPSVARWRLAALPKGLEPGEVSRLLAACDRRTSVGRRDYAVLLLMARLGLRAGEVAALQLDDIDWRTGELVVRGKGGRRERLPLPDDVGEAVAGYLRRGRPSTAQDRSVFVRVRAPNRGLSTPGVSDIAHRAGQRAGLNEPVRAHRLRHTTATHLLAAGAPLVEIGQLLRHRRQLTTAIYAKVDRDALRTLARPWPGGAR